MIRVGKGKPVRPLKNLNWEKKVLQIAVLNLLSNLCGVMVSMPALELFWV